MTATHECKVTELIFVRYTVDFRKGVVFQESLKRMSANYKQQLADAYNAYNQGASVMPHQIEILVHATHNGTEKSPVVGVETKHGKLWGRDPEHLSKLVRFVYGHKPVFTGRRLDDSEVERSVLRHIGAAAAMSNLEKAKQLFPATAGTKNHAPFRTVVWQNRLATTGRTVLALECGHEVELPRLVKVERKRARCDQCING